MSNGAGVALLVLLAVGAVVISKFFEQIRKWALISAAIAAGGYLVLPFLWRLAGEVFSWRGLAWSFGLAGPDGLTFPLLVRVVTLVSLVEGAAVVSMLLDRQQLQNDETRGKFTALLIAHASLVRRIVTVLVSCLRVLAEFAADTWQRCPTAAEAGASTRAGATGEWAMGAWLSILRYFGRSDSGARARVAVFASNQLPDLELTDEERRFGTAL